MGAKVETAGKMKTIEFLFHEHEGKMIYIEFVDNKKPKDKERDSLFFKRIVYPFLSFILPKANPDFDHLYEKVHLWYLEYDDLNKYTCREIGIDDNNTVIVKAPYKDNVGYWTDNDMTLESYASHFNIKYIDKEKFDSIWDLELGTKISLT